MMVVCRIHSVVHGELDRQMLLAMLPFTLHQALRDYLDSKGAPSFNYALFDIVFDTRALMLSVASFLEKCHFANPLTVVQPGKRKPDNLGRGLVRASHGSCSDLLMYLGKHSVMRQSALPRPLLGGSGAPHGNVVGDNTEPTQASVEDLAQRAQC